MPSGPRHCKHTRERVFTGLTIAVSPEAGVPRWVRVKYRSPLTKEFTVVSVTGSKLVIEKVFQKLLQAEKEALREDHERLSALDSENYTFKLLGGEPSTPQNGPLYAV
jgi:hypothetical protein